MSGAYAGERPIGRAVAHYHRLLSELLPALVEDAEAGEAQIVWLDEVQRHVIRDDAPNEYARAAYLLKDLGRHEHAFQELERVQREVQRLAAEQGDNADLLVTPEVRTGIKHVRLQKVDTFVSTTMTGAAARGGVAQVRNRLARDLSAEHAAGMSGSAELLAEAERALEALKDVENVRARWPYTRYHAVLHPLDESLESERVYVTKPGLIAVGPGVSLSWADAPRRRRSDRVTLAPLAEFQGRLYYDLEEWEAARDAAREG